MMLKMPKGEMTMALELRPLTINDGDDVYDMLQRLPADENGFMNPMAGKSREEFRAWLVRQAANALKTEIEDGYRVPQAIYWLYEDGKPVGMGKLRYFLTDALRRSGGHIGYAVAPEARGRGLATFMLKKLLREAALHGVDRALITVNNCNPASIRVAVNCGGEIERISEDHHYVWCDCK